MHASDSSELSSGTSVPILVVRPMKAIQILALVVVLTISIASCSSKEEPFRAAQVKHWQKLVAKELPPGSSIKHSMAFFKTQGVESRFDSDKNILYAPQNIEPEPKSLLPFGLIKSYDIQCRFNSNKELIACSVETSGKRWDKP